MAYVITDEQYFKDIADATRQKLRVDTTWTPENLANAIGSIPSTADGSNNPLGAVYLLDPDGVGYVTEVVGVGLGSTPNMTAVNIITFAFEYNTRVKKVSYINCDNYTSIGINAFMNCSALTTINLPSSLTSISGTAFKSCSALTTINLPSSLTSIGNNAFMSCSALTTINLPSSLTSLSGSAFTNCWRLIDVTLGDNFNCNSLNLSASTLYSRETILQWFNALADRTGSTAYTLTIGAKNLAKLTEQDILIATNKNWTLA